MRLTRHFLLVPGATLALCLAGALAQPARGSDSVASPARAATGTSSPAVLDPTNGLGSWIWAAETYDRQTCWFWRSFEVPNSAPIVRALLRITADNGYTVFLDGRKVGEGSYWKTVTEYDLTWLLVPGTHVLGVQAFNDGDKAGLIAGLRVQLADGAVIEVGSDESWRVVPETARDWQRRQVAPKRWPSAKLIGAWGAPPWWRIPLKVAAVPPERPIPLQFWQTGWFQVGLLTVCGIVVLICLRLMTQIALQSKAQKLLQVERARIARDIHDDLGAGLTKLVLLGEVAQSELQTDSATRVQISQLCEKARDLSHVMDEVVWAINSRRDTLRDFASYVCKYAQTFFGSTPIRCRLDVEPDLPTMPFDLPLRRNLFLAVKEALNNAAKHSQATELFLRIHRWGEGLAVVVQDNGRGLDLARASAERNGLTNMAQRMSEAAGTCQVSGAPGAGCRVEFRLPRLHSQRQPWWRGWLLGRFQHLKAPAPVTQAGSITERVSGSQSLSL
jgi:signal transduction histidine kinase